MMALKWRRRRANEQKTRNSDPNMKNGDQLLKEGVVGVLDELIGDMELSG